MPYQSILDEIVKKSREILGKSLTGVYLHGSMVMGCFQPKRSDIDLIIVIEGDMSNVQKMAFMEQIVDINRKAPPKGLEISIVQRRYCSPFTYPTPFELHFSPMHLQWFMEQPRDYIEKMKGDDIDLAAHFTIIRKYGIVLWGQKIEDIFAPVPKQNYKDSILADIRNAPEDILEQPVYITLNLCRVLAFIKEELYLSKKEGGEWGVEHLPLKYHSLITEALRCYASGKEMMVEEECAVSFAKEMLQDISYSITRRDDEK